MMHVEVAQSNTAWLGICLALAVDKRCWAEFAGVTDARVRRIIRKYHGFKNNPVFVSDVYLQSNKRTALLINKIKSHM